VFCSKVVVCGLVWMMTRDGIGRTGLSKLGGLWLYLVISSLLLLSEPATESIGLLNPRI
jgi:hypothetical protein